MSAAQQGYITKLTNVMVTVASSATVCWCVCVFVWGYNKSIALTKPLH